MNILGVGPAELLLILVIMLIVAGPKRMIQWAYILGQYMAKLREMWRTIMESLQKEFDEAGVDIKLPKELPTRSDINRVASDALRPLQEPMQQAMTEYEAERQGINREITDMAKEADPKRDLEKVLKESPAPTDSRPKSAFGTWAGAKPPKSQE